MTMPKIQIFVNGEYAYTTMQYQMVKAAIRALYDARVVTVASIPSYRVSVTSYDKITGRKVS